MADLFQFDLSVLGLSNTATQNEDMINFLSMKILLRKQSIVAVDQLRQQNTFTS